MHSKTLRLRTMLRRRLHVLAGLAWLAGALPIAGAQQRRPGGAPLRAGFERALVDSGLATALRRGFAADTGLNALPVAGTSSGLLEALERGEIDLAITHAPLLEAKLAAQGFVHDRHPVARTDFVIVGPVDRGKDPAGVAGGADAASALARIAQSGAPFLSLGDGSGTHLAEQALWRAAGVAPSAPGYRSIDGEGGGLLVQTRALGAYTLIDRASWLALGDAVRRRAAAPLLAVLVEGDARLVTDFHVQRSFRINHPAGKLFVAWLSGRAGRRAVARVRGFRSVS